MNVMRTDVDYLSLHGRSRQAGIRGLRRSAAGRVGCRAVPLRAFPSMLRAGSELGMLPHPEYEEHMLSNREFSALVDQAKFPEQVAVPLDAPFVNVNGEIQNLLLERFTSVALIRSVAGAVRANHYHKTDWHYSYVLSGCVWYYWRQAGSGDQPRHENFAAGTMFFTPPMVEHAMVFPEETSFLTFARNIRDNEHHEADLVRVPLVEVRGDSSAKSGWKVSFP